MAKIDVNHHEVPKTRRTAKKVYGNTPTVKKTKNTGPSYASNTGSPVNLPQPAFSNAINRGKTVKKIKK